jgi:hypothetical protein
MVDDVNPEASNKLWNSRLPGCDAVTAISRSNLLSNVSLTVKEDAEYKEKRMSEEARTSRQGKTQFDVSCEICIGDTTQSIGVVDGRLTLTIF